MKTYDVKEKWEEFGSLLKECDGEEIIYYNGHTSIDDVISEMADNHTSIYYSDIRKFLIEHLYEVEDCINELGWEGVGSSLHKASQCAEYQFNSNQLYRNIDNMIMYYGLYYYKENYNSTIDVELYGELENLSNNADPLSYLDEIEDTIDKYMILEGGEENEE